MSTRYRPNCTGLSSPGPGDLPAARRGGAGRAGLPGVRRGHAEPRRWLRPPSIALLLAMSLVALVLPACSYSRPAPTELAVQPADYERVVSVARDTLLEARFEIDRVDAAAGVITTHPRGTGGLLTPWDNQPTTPGQGLHDAANTHLRRVRITFEPAAIDRLDPGAGQAAADAAGSPAPAPIDLRTAGLPMTARVEVFIDRVRRPGVRLETESIRTSSLSLDPELAARGMTPEYRTTIGRDDLLAGRLADRIRERLGE